MQQCNPQNRPSIIPGILEAPIRSIPTRFRHAIVAQTQRVKGLSSTVILWENNKSRCIDHNKPTLWLDSQPSQRRGTFGLRFAFIPGEFGACRSPQELELVAGFKLPSSLKMKLQNYCGRTCGSDLDTCTGYDRIVLDNQEHSESWPI